MRVIQTVRVLFGLTNGLGQFQHFMENCLIDIHDKFAFTYLDDITVFLSSIELHIEYLRTVFKQLKWKSMKINSEKCKFFQRR